MLTQLSSIFVSCILIAGCGNSSKAELESNFINLQSQKYTQKTAATKIIKNHNDFQIKPKSLGFSESVSSKSKEITNHKNTAVTNNHQSSKPVNYMTLTRTEGRFNRFGNPLYKLRLFVNGQETSNHLTVSGRHYSQNRDRDLSGTEAPLPNGKYGVAQHHIPGTHSEVGGRFLPIYPKFTTGRSALGIHYDPSFDKSEKDDGTAGCVALTNKEELDIVLEYIRIYQPEYFEVQI